MQTGLVFGNFAPFHKGHQFLVEMALRENGRVIVLVYDRPDVTLATAAERARWIEQSFGLDRSKLAVIPCTGLLPAGKGEGPRQARAKFIKDQLALAELDGPINIVYCNKTLGRSVAHMLNAAWEKIDPDHSLFPIESADIRAKPSAYGDALPSLAAGPILAALMRQTATQPLRRIDLTASGQTQAPPLIHFPR